MKKLLTMSAGELRFRQCQGFCFHMVQYVGALLGCWSGDAGGKGAGCFFPIQVLHQQSANLGGGTHPQLISHGGGGLAGGRPAPTPRDYIHTGLTNEGSGYTLCTNKGRSVMYARPPPPPPPTATNPAEPVWYATTYARMVVHYKSERMVRYSLSTTWAN